MIRLALLLAAAVALAVLVRPPRQLAGSAGDLLLPDPRIIRIAARSHLSLATDFYWIRMTHLASVARTAEESRALVALGEFVTELDPKMYWAYVVGGLLGPFPLEGGATWVNGKESAALLEKGTRHIPKDPKLFILLSYAQLNYLHDKLAAAATLERGAGSGPDSRFLAQLATRLYAAGGRFEAARAFASTMIEQATDEETRALFAQRLKEIDLEETLVQVDEARARFKEREGHEPAGVRQLLWSGDLTAEPVDPFGGTIELGFQGAYSTASRKRLRVFGLEEDP